MDVHGFVIRRWELSPYPGPQAPLHVHHRDDEGFVVLDGLLDVTLGDDVRRLGPGEFVVVPAGTAHTFATVDHTPAVVLATMTSRIDELVRRLHTVPDDERAALWERYASAVV